MSRMFSRISKKRVAGRLEGTHAFPFDRLAQTRAKGGLLDKVDRAAEQHYQVVAQRIHAPEMIKSTG